MASDPIQIPLSSAVAEQTIEPNTTKEILLPSQLDRDATIPSVDITDAHEPSLPEITSSAQAASDASPNPDTVIRARRKSVLMETPDETMLRLSNDFVPVIERDADTLLYIGTPARMANQDEHEYEYIRQHFEKPYLMQSTTLRNLGSAKFDKMLGPMSARTERRLKKLDLHRRVSSPDKIKYYIDLRPVIEEDEGMLLLSMMTSMPGVLKWYRRGRDFGSRGELIDGVDDLNAPPRPKFDSFIDESDRDSTPESAKTSISKRRKLVNKNTQETFPDPREGAIEQEYSPLRHHSAIERLLHAIAGDDPKINSAPKAWTYCAVAKYFDCTANDSINKWLMSWLLAPNNVNFIQCNPEVVYRMALAMQSPGLLRCAYAVLVGEKALAQAETEEVQGTKHDQHKAVLGRELTFVDDDDINRIDHAATSLLNRVRSVFYRLISPALEWTELSAEKQRKLNPDDTVPPEEVMLLASMRAKLTDYVRRKILTILSMEGEKISDEVLPHGLDAKSIYCLEPFNELDPRLRMYTQLSWIMLHQYAFIADHHHFDTPVFWEQTQRTLIDLGILGDDEHIDFVTRDDLLVAADDYNEYLRHKTCRIFPRFAPGAPSFNGTSSLQDHEARGFDEYGRPLKYYNPEHKTWKTNLSYRPGPSVKDQMSISRITNHENELNSETCSQDEKTTPTSAYVQPRSFLEEGVKTTSKTNNELDSDINFSSPKTVRFATTRDPLTAAMQPAVEEPTRQTASDAPFEILRSDIVPQNRQPIGPYSRRVNAIRRASFYHDERSEQLGLISTLELLNQLNTELRRIIENNIIVPGYVLDMTCEWDIPTTEINTLLCLTDDEWKYLPLWAGGLDDGSGGVFDDGMEVPDAPDVGEGGFRGGLAGLVSGPSSEADNQSMLGDEDFSDIGTEVGVSTVGKASRMAVDGTVGGGSTVMSLDE